MRKFLKILSKQCKRTSKAKYFGSHVSEVYLLQSYQINTKALRKQNIYCHIPWCCIPMHLRVSYTFSFPSHDSNMSLVTNAKPLIPKSSVSRVTTTRYIFHPELVIYKYTVEF